jgi:electron transfer flavoprotein beta subunit
MHIAVVLDDIWEAASLEIDPLSGAIDECRAVAVLNPSGVAGLEIARQLVAARTGILSVFSVAPAAADARLRMCLALGAETVTRIWDDWLRAAPSMIVAQVLADAIAPTTPDLILIGNRDRDHAQSAMGPMLAGYLGWSQLTAVEAIAFDDERQLVVARRRLGRGQREQLETPLPVVVCLEPDAAQPREASLPAVLATSAAPIGIIRPHPIDGPVPRFIATATPRPRPLRRVEPDPTAPVDERLAAIMGQGTGFQSHERVSGSPDDVADHIVEFLRRRGFVLASAER